MHDAPSNPRLLQAIAATLGASELALETLLRPLLNELVESTLVTAKEPILLRRRLALFTDVVELHLYAASAAWVPLRADEAIKRVARGTYAGLVINPGPRQFELSREDVQDFFDIDD